MTKWLSCIVRWCSSWTASIPDTPGAADFGHPLPPFPVSHIQTAMPERRMKMKFQRAARGLIYRFGTHFFEEKPIEWIVLDTNTNEGTVLITTVKSVGMVPYGRISSNQVTWADSYVREWLNRYFYRSFNAAERKAIHINLTCETEDEPVMDNFFLLTEGEASLFFESDENRALLCSDDLYEIRSGGRSLRDTCEWWLRDDSVTENSDAQYKVPVINKKGELGETRYADSTRTGVRPCAWVDADALMEVKNPELEALNIRLGERERTGMTVYQDGRQQNLEVLAEFYDDDTKQAYAVVVTDRSYGKPRIVRLNVDFCIKSYLEDKFQPLLEALRTRPYHGVMDLLQYQQDEKAVSVWMIQQAWIPTAGYHQPEIDDKGACLIRLGEYNGRAIYWRVLKRSSNKLLAIAEDGFLYDQMHWEGDDYPAFDVTWETSTLRHWLNSDNFIDSVFSRKEQEHILYCRTVEETETAPPVFDLVFLLSDAEASIFLDSDRRRHLSGTPDFKAPIGMRDEYDRRDRWWLRTEGRDAEAFCYVDTDGVIDRDGIHHSEYLAVRPAILVELTEDSIPYMIIGKDTDNIDDLL